MCVCVLGEEFFEPGNPKGGELKKFWKSGGNGVKISWINYDM